MITYYVFLALIEMQSALNRDRPLCMSLSIQTPLFHSIAKSRRHDKAYI